MTRLCDLTNDNDTVTSVSWAERGNFVAVGTHRGYVQVFFASSFKKSHRSKTLRSYLEGGSTNHLNISPVSTDRHEVAPLRPGDRGHCVVVVGQVAQPGHLNDIKF